MAIIYSYPKSLDVLASDLLLGTSTKIVAGKKKNITKNFSVGDLGLFIQDNYPQPIPNLDQVLFVGNTSILDANVGVLGLWDSASSNYITIGTTDQGITFNVPSIGQIFLVQNNNITFGNATIVNNLLSTSRLYNLPNQSGTIALTSDIPVVIVPTLQEVTDQGNTTTNNITVTDGIGLYVQINNAGSIQSENTLLNKRTAISANEGLLLATGNSSNPSFIKNDYVINDNTYLQVPNKIGGEYTIATTDDIPSITPSALTKVNDTNVTLTLGGTPATALLQGVSLTLGWTGTLADSRIASSSTWNAKQNAITLTTTGSSGPATLIANTLNIPQYAGGGSGVTPYYGAFIFDSATTLTASMNSNSTAPIQVVDTTGFFAPGYIKIGTEIIKYTGKTLTTFTGITRGAVGSNGATHPIGALVSQAQAALANTATQVKLDQTDLSNGVTLSGDGDVTIANAGIYNLQFSIQIENFSNAYQDTAVWFRVNGVDIPKSTSYMTSVQSHGGTPGIFIMTVNIFYSLNAGDVVSIMWASINGLTAISSVSPTVNIPQSPGIIFTVNRIG